MNNKFCIDQTKCIKCRKCIEVCPIDLIEWSPEIKEVKFTKNVDEFCIRCGHCMAICNNLAITLPKMNNKSLQKVLDNPKHCNDIVENIIKSRRSIRRYKKIKIQKNEIKKIIDTASYAPSASNARLLNWKVYSDEQILYEISRLTMEWMKEKLMNKNNSLSERYVKIFNRYIDLWNNGIDGILRSAPHFVIIHGPNTGTMRNIDGIIALDYFEFSAISKGFGTCWAGLFYYAFEDNYEPLLRLINLPKNHTCYGAMMLGYPKYKYPLTLERKATEICFINNNDE